MKSWWSDVREYVDSKTMREKLILLSMLLAVIFFIANFVILTPLQKKLALSQAQLQLIQTDIKKFSAQEKVFAKALLDDPNAAKKREIVGLRNHVGELDEELSALSAGLIPADKLPLALHQVLQSVRSLSLVAMEARTPTKLSLDDQTQDTGDDHGNSADVGLFKHSVRVSLEGKYFDVVQYLKALEQLTWKIYWESLDYEVIDYPRAKVMIEVYTLSTEEGIWGV